MTHVLHITLLVLGGLALLLVTGSFLLMAKFPEVVYPSNDIEPDNED